MTANRTNTNGSHRNGYGFPVPDDEPDGQANTASEKVAEAEASDDRLHNINLTEVMNLGKEGWFLELHRRDVESQIAGLTKALEDIKVKQLEYVARVARATMGIELKLYNY